MGKRQEIKKRKRQKIIRNRLWAILAIIGGALLISMVLILPSINSSDPGQINQITPISDAIPVNKTSMGYSDAPVKMDVWEDFQCSGCLYYSENLEPQIIQAYVETGEVYYTFHVFPFIDGGRGESQDSANAAMCAAEQNRFWDYHGMIFANWLGENIGSFSKPRLIAFAENLKLDMTAFNQCFQENTYAAQIQQDMDDGAKLGVPPTPGIFVNGKIVTNSENENYIASIEDISLAIETELSTE